MIVVMRPIRSAIALMSARAPRIAVVCGL